MKTIINAILIVEGKTDIDFLSSFLGCKFYSVNGSAINEKDINFINECVKTNKVIVLTDPDFPGKQIRNKINESCPGVYNAFVRKEVSIKKNKVGVAESTKEEVLNGIKNAVKFEEIKENNKASISITDLYRLKLVGNEESDFLRKKVSENFHIGYCNGKMFLKRLNMLNISLEELEKEVSKYVK